jgi:hypothetical protein
MIDKMKRNYLLTLGLVVLLTMLILPVSASKKMEYKANGKVIQYDASYYPTPPSSMVVNGNWNLKVVDGNVDFQLSYTEMNLISEPEGGAPVGSKDLFKITFLPDTIGSTPFVDEGGGYWVIAGDFYFDKLAAQPDGSKVWIYNFMSPQGGAVNLYPGDVFTLDAGPWHLVGSINSMK